MKKTNYSSFLPVFNVHFAKKFSILKKGRKIRSSTKGESIKFNIENDGRPKNKAAKNGV